MDLLLILLAALFLPLFPLSMVFNQILARLRPAWARVLLLLIWPQLGVALIGLEALRPLPDWLPLWALFSAGFYAYRAIALRDVGLWIGFIATSAWALFWLADAPPLWLHLQVLGISLPLVLLSVITDVLRQRLGAAHAALGGGLASSAPRLAGLFVLAMLAAVATPLFPGFFILLGGIALQAPTAPILALAMLAVWLLWSWSGALLLQAIVVGPQRQDPVADVSVSAAWLFAIAYLLLALSGIYFVGELL